MKEVRMTGRYAEDLLAIARTQLGYTESADNFIVTEEGARQGYTRYGQWQGDAYEPWDAAFAAFCLYYAGVRDVPADTKAEKWADELKRRGMYRDLTAENRPEEGDFLFTRDGEVTRIGLVEKTDDTGVTAIEGDVGGAVARVTYGWDDARLAGFGDPRTTLTDEAAGVTVTGIFPEGATLTVQLLAEDADGFTEAQDRIHAALSPLYDRYAVNLADVTETAVYVPSLTVNGEVVSPCKKVRVGVSACGGRFAGHGDVRVLTFSDEQTELLSAEEKDGGIEAYVKPVAVEKDSFLGRCGSEFNAVQIDCNMAGPIFLQGKGAGPEPTGSAVLGDIIEIAQAIAAGTEHEQPFTALI